MRLGSLYKVATMLKQTYAFLLGASIILLGSVALGSTTGAPGTPNSAPDPCKTCKIPPPVQICKTVKTSECAEYQGNPPHCRRFEIVSHEVCS
jgi:hypothetical protein